MIEYMSAPETRRETRRSPSLPDGLGFRREDQERTARFDGGSDTDVITSGLLEKDFTVS